MPQLICVQMLLGTLLKNRLKSKKWKLSRKSQLWKSVFSLQNKPVQFENWRIFLVIAESWGFRINFLRLNQHIHSENHSQDPGTLDQRTIGRNTDSSFSESECEPARRWGTAISEQLSRDPTRFPLWMKVQETLEAQAVKWKHKWCKTDPQLSTANSRSTDNVTARVVT